MQTTINEGDRVRCLQGSIDKNIGAGLVGVVEGFARFSSYHGREVLIRFGPKAWEGEPHPADGWFWLSTVEPVADVN